MSEQAPDERSKLAFTARFLDEAYARGVITREPYMELRLEIERRLTALDRPQTVVAPARTGTAARSTVSRPPAPPPRPDAGALPRPETVRTSVPTETVRRAATPAQTFEPKLRTHEAWAPWVQRGREVRRLVASDFGLHGLAYLGVLLTFAGTFGFILFAFRGVARAWRPVAEAVIPAVFFGSAWFLRRREASLVAVGLELVGGALLPVVAFASFVDEAAVPPDPTGGGLIAALTVTSLALAAGFAVWTSRHPSSPLRYLAGPVGWLALMTVGFVFKGGEPLAGQAIERPVAAQPALAAVAIPLTLLLLAGRRDHPLTGPTFLSAVPAIVLTYALTLGLSAGQGWEAGPVLLAGFGALATTELLGSRFGRPVAWPALQAALIWIALATLLPAWGVGWTGVAATGVSISFTEFHARRRSRLGVALGAGGALAGLAMSIGAPWAWVVGWALAAAWTHFRRITGLAGLTDRTGRTGLVVAAAVAPVGLAGGALNAAPMGPAWVAITGTVAAAAIVVRQIRSTDRFWRIWIPGAAGAATLGILFARSAGLDVPSGQLAAAAGLAALALGASLEDPAVRLWSSSAAAALALALAFEAAGLEGRWLPTAWAAVSFGSVLAAAGWRGPAAGHLAAVGHAVGIGALIAPSTGGPRVAVLAAFAASSLATTASQELGDGPLARLLGRVARGWRPATIVAWSVAPIAMASSLPFVVVRSLSLWGRFAAHRSWMGVALSAIALAYAAGARVTAGRKPLARILAAGGAALSAIAVAIAAPAPWPVIEAAAAAIAVVALLGGELRGSVMTWFAWTMSGVLSVLLAGRAGVPTADLNLVSLGWGAVLLLGGLAYDDVRSGRRRPGEGLRTGWLIHPVALGALAVPVSAAPLLTRSPDVFGWWLAGLAVFYLGVAVLLRVGAVSGVSYALAVSAAVALLPRSALDRPWMFVPMAAVLVAAAWLLEPRADRTGADRWLRWDLPPLIVAHGVAAVALARTGEAGFVPQTWSGFGTLSALVALWQRNRLWADAGNALILVGAALAGPEWLAVALAATCVRGLVVATRSSGWGRTLEQSIAVGAAAGAWASTLVWADWPLDWDVMVTSLVFGALALATGAAARFARLGRDWLFWWGGLAAVGVGASVAASPGNLNGPLPALGTSMLGAGAAMAARRAAGSWPKWLAVLSAGAAWGELAVGSHWSGGRTASLTAMVAGGVALGIALALRARVVDRDWAAAAGAVALAWMGIAVALAPAGNRPVWMGLAGGLALFGLGVGGSARPMGLPWLRDVAAVFALAAEATVGAGLTWSTEGRAYALVAMGLVSTAGSLAVWRRSPTSRWLRPLAVFGSANAVLAVGMGLDSLPMRGPLVSALVAAGVETAAAGLTLRKPQLLYAAPLLLCGAWIVFASDALSGNPEWFTVPSGLALLMVVELVRWTRRSAGRPAGTGELMALEFLGLGFLVGAALGQTLSDGPLYGLLAVALGAGVMGWGGLTRVRRRVAGGAGVALLAVVLMLAAPIAHRLPQFRGAALWITVAVVGAALVVVATFLERGLAKLRATARKLGELMEGWE